MHSLSRAFVHKIIEEVTRRVSAPEEQVPELEDSIETSSFERKNPNTGKAFMVRPFNLKKSNKKFL